MSFKSTAAHMLNDFSELVYPRSAEGYRLYFGIDHGLSKVVYTERMVEIPFVFKSISSGSDVLDIGCSESPICIQLAMQGYNVTGIDMQDYRYRHRNFKFVRADFLRHNFNEKFDTVINVSAIEHFGIVAYKNTAQDISADGKAVAKARKLLKRNGRLIFTAPYGVSTVLHTMRIYSEKDLAALLKGFRILDKEYYRVRGRAEIKRVSASQASSLAYSPGDYCVVLINAAKAGR